MSSSFLLKPVSNGSEEEYTDDPEEEAAADGADDEPPVPLVVCVEGVDSEEEEDHHLCTVGQHVGGAADGGAGAVRDVLLHVVLHGDATEGDAEDAGHVEELGGEVGEVGEGQHHQGLQHPGLGTQVEPWPCP